MKAVILSCLIFLFSISFHFGEINLTSSNRGFLHYQQEKFFFIGDNWYFKVSIDSQNNVFLLSSKSIHQLDLNKMILGEEFNGILLSKEMSPTVVQAKYSFRAVEDDYLNVLVPIKLSGENQFFDGHISFIDYGFGVLRTNIYVNKPNELELLFSSLRINIKSVDLEDYTLEKILELVDERRKKHNDLFSSDPLEESNLDPFQNIPTTP